MSEVFHIGDLHFGHKNIHKFRPKVGELEIQCEVTHREAVIELWNKTVSKRDVVWLHGDVLFEASLLHQLGRLNGNKNLILGNHDIQLRDWVYFNKVVGFEKYKRTWLSHAPIHPAELRGKLNIHGHVHYATITTPEGVVDERYFNCSIENINGRPIAYNVIMEKYNRQMVG